MSDAKVLSQSAFTAVINAPADQVDIADWLLHLPDAEYQRCCPPDHISAGSTSTDDGRPMSINVEQIGMALLIQHYVAETAEPQHCHMVSHSDVYDRDGHTHLQVVWDLSVAPIDDGHCQYTNSVTAHTTPEFMAFIAAHGTSLEQAAAARQAASSDHNSRETPLFAKSIERKAVTSSMA